MICLASAVDGHAEVLVSAAIVYGSQSTEYLHTIYYYVWPEQYSRLHIYRYNGWNLQGEV